MTQQEPNDISTYLGGDSDELPHSMVVNSSNELFIFGTTSSINFPTTNGAYQTSFNGGWRCWRFGRYF